MIIVEGKLDYSQAHIAPEEEVLLFTGNAIVNGRGGLVMGRGAAREVRDLYPGIDLDYGDTLLRNMGMWSQHGYGVIWPQSPEWPRIGVFQVKRRYDQPAILTVIANSAAILGRMAKSRWGEWRTFHMNFPGVGNGSLTFDDVYPVVQPLPENVRLYL